MAKRTLGSFIASYKYKYKKKTGNDQHDVDAIIKRLEGYQKYKRQVRNEIDNYKRAQNNKFLKKLKKFSYQKAYSIKPVRNPYAELSRNFHTLPDPKLYERYKSKNIFAMHEFRHLKLPLSNNTITAGQGWHGLIKAWKGYKIAKHWQNDERMKTYASATQKYAHMLMLPTLPDFADIGLSSLGFNNAKALKEFFIGYENEVEF